MGHKRFCLLATLLVLTFTILIEGAQIPTKCQCKVPGGKRNDCGFPGITAEECHRRGCCFDASIPGVKWCFHPYSKAGECSVSVKERRDCGYPGISSKTCEQRGCCFDSANVDSVWCFHPKVKKHFDCHFTDNLLNMIPL
uniref:P-type domain-containing protein n=1 Tax=Sphenodon punctatus TaxID=8508 RepID=A0A8D0HCL8_SPHPU